MKAYILCLARRALTIAILAFPTVSHAEEILTVTVNGQSETLSYDDLLALPQLTIVTKNDYVNSSVEFTGPSLKALLSQYDIGPDETLIMRAINDFSVSVPASDAFQYDVVLAMFSNGERMSVREKGPIWVIYPMDDHDELRDDVYNSRIVWQLKSITVE